MAEVSHAVLPVLFGRVHFVVLFPVRAFHSLWTGPVYVRYVLLLFRGVLYHGPGHHIISGEEFIYLLLEFFAGFFSVICPFAATAY